MGGRAGVVGAVLVVMNCACCLQAGFVRMLLALCKHISWARVGGCC